MNNFSFKEAEKSPHDHLSKLQIEISKVIYTKMKEIGWSKAELARKLKVSRQLIHKLLKCDQNITLLTLVKISMALNLTFEIKFNE